MAQGFKVNFLKVGKVIDSMVIDASDKFHEEVVLDEMIARGADDFTMVSGTFARTPASVWGVKFNEEVA